MSIPSKRILTALALTGFMVSMHPMLGESTKSEPSEIVVGGGCFWCIEALFETIDGVLSVQSGYAGGDVDNPTYQAVCSGTTGHAEVVRIAFEPEKVSLEKLLEFFWEAHDPTTLNRQGADVGTQYRSIILFQDQVQEAAIRESMKQAQAQFRDPIVTEISKLETFYPAEKYHQDYFQNNPNAPYCRFVIVPKLKKLES